MTKIPRTDLDVFPLCLGGNVFGWTADRDESFAVLDGYLAGGGNFVDTADVYMAAIPGNSGGESETIIGEWTAARGNRDDVVIATKVGKLPEHEGLGRETIHAAADASLKRLGTDHIDLYYAHADDPDTPLEETLGAFGELIAAGKVRYVAASNYSAERLAEALAVAEREGLPRYVALQPEYNLVEREYKTDGLLELCEREDLACFPFFALAAGFLTGKYRDADDGERDGLRSKMVSKYLDDAGAGAVLSALDEIAAAHSVHVAAAALAWLRQQPTVAAPIASARNAEQLAPLLESAALELDAGELDALSSAAAS
jgi:aryl-alcohol dehydrogenase-like predicted oxidoreductase